MLGPYIHPSAIQSSIPPSPRVPQFITPMLIYPSMLILELQPTAIHPFNPPNGPSVPWPGVPPHTLTFLHTYYLQKCDPSAFHPAIRLSILLHIVIKAPNVHHHSVGDYYNNPYTYQLHATDERQSASSTTAPHRVPPVQ